MHNLLAAHALRGCNTVSSFAGIRKSSVLKKLASYGDELVLSDPSASLNDVTAFCLKFGTALYGQSFPRTVHEMRKDIFTKNIVAKRHLPPKLCSLPPTMAVFEQHCARAPLQVSIRKAARSSASPNLHPLNHGRKKSINPSSNTVLKL